MTRNDLIDLAVSTLNSARDVADNAKQDSLVRVALGYANLLPYVGDK